MRGAKIVVRGSLADRKYIAFWVQDGKVVAGMNVSIWDVNETVKLIRSEKQIEEARLTDGVSRPRELGYGVIVDPRIDTPHHKLGATEVDFRTKVAVMAIINRSTAPIPSTTRAQLLSSDAAVQAGRDALEAGADLLDIGAGA